MGVRREEDVKMLKSLEVSPEKISMLGNLKYDVLTACVDRAADLDERKFPLPENRTILVAGSTHPGEEEILLSVFKKIHSIHSDLFLVIAPREISRAQSIKQLAERIGVRMYLRTGAMIADSDGMVLNTLGELASIYSLSDFAFVGGSLVPKRGHNPLEPAAKGKIVLFGHHMEDFVNIVADMLRSNIAIQVESADELESEIKRLLAAKGMLSKYGKRASEFVLERQGVTRRHIDLVKKII